MIAYASQQPDWAIDFLDEVWWSRFALPRVQAWQNPLGERVRLVNFDELRALFDTYGSRKDDDDDDDE